MNTWVLLFILVTQFVFAGFAASAFYFVVRMACRRFGNQDAAIADLRDQVDAHIRHEEA